MPYRLSRDCTREATGLTSLQVAYSWLVDTWIWQGRIGWDEDEALPSMTSSERQVQA
jgi:hypothetical protein